MSVLDLNGLEYFWKKIKSRFTSIESSVKTLKADMVVNSDNISLLNDVISECLNNKYESFEEIPEPAESGFVACIVEYVGIDSNSPHPTESNHWWWNVISIGTSTRRTQIAFSPFRNQNKIYMRQIHDTVKYGWYSMTLS